MTYCFVLRFQEPCVDARGQVIEAGTETHTRVQREGVDVDPSSPRFTTMPKADKGTGTATHTRIATEEGDTDASHSMRSLPLTRSLGTATKTSVSTEKGDSDRTHRQVSVLMK
jgi:hypothetical protein